MLAIFARNQSVYTTKLCRNLLTAVAVCSAVTATYAFSVHKSGVSPRDEMASIPGGEFLMGADDGEEYEKPVHKVTVKPFRMDCTEVTNKAFRYFVDSTHYVTDAEKQGNSLVFDAVLDDFKPVAGACWRYPQGLMSPGVKDDEPVTQVTWNDATAYAQWSGKRLPTEAEWEYAARGGLESKRYPWGNTEPVDKGHFQANLTGKQDGYSGIAPVGKYPANGYGLYDMAGNLWEWCSDGFQQNAYKSSRTQTIQTSLSGPNKVLRGGSWICGGSHCSSYRVAARGYGNKASAMNHRGFRCVMP